MQVENNEATTVEATEEAPKVKAAPKKKAAAKKEVKKAAPKKAAKVVKMKAEKPVPDILRANNMKDAIKLLKSGELKRGIISVGGMKYAFSVRTTWAINKSLIEKSDKGLIMIIEDEGHYVYPKAKFTELFGAIFKSSTYKTVGTYSQSVLPQWHSDYFTPAK